MILLCCLFLYICSIFFSYARNLFFVPFAQYMLCSSCDISCSNTCFFDTVGSPFHSLGWCIYMRSNNDGAISLVHAGYKCDILVGSRSYGVTHSRVISSLTGGMNKLSSFFEGVLFQSRFQVCILILHPFFFSFFFISEQTNETPKCIVRNYNPCFSFYNTNFFLFASVTT